MNYKQRNATVTTVEECVLMRAGLGRQEFFCPEEEPEIPNLKEAVAFFRANMQLPVTVIGDYDADGICGTAILYHGLKRMQKEARLRIPKRFSEGYGLSEKIIDEIEAPGLVITVDNGIAALDAIKKAKEKGLSVIVIDHHEPVCRDNKVVLPCADVVVDPKTGNSYRDYCGAGLAYRFVKELVGGDMNNLLVLAAVATVADVMPLTGANRILVRRGIEALNKGYGVPGLKALAGNNKKEGHFDEGDFGFWFGPIFNAYGRLEDGGAAKVLRLLTMGYNDPKIPGCVRMLMEMNERRKSFAREQTELAEALIQDMDGNAERPIVVGDSLFDPGIVGIIAGKLAEKYYSPAIVFSEKDGMLKGSGRSIPGVSLKETLDRISGLMLSYGGHSGAAGLTIHAEDFLKFKSAFAKSIGRLPDVPDVMYYDLDLKRHEIPYVMEQQRSLAPFGEGNPKPVFRIVFNTADFIYARMGDGTHFSLTERSQDGAPAFSVVGFGMAGMYEKMNPERIECLGCLNENWYNDRLSYQFELAAFTGL